MSEDPSEKRRLLALEFVAARHPQFGVAALLVDAAAVAAFLAGESTSKQATDGAEKPSRGRRGWSPEQRAAAAERARRTPGFGGNVRKQAAPPVAEEPVPAAVATPPRIASFSPVPRPAVGTDPIEADLEQVMTWAGQRGIEIRSWSGLDAVNAKRRSLGQPPFKQRQRADRPAS